MDSCIPGLDAEVVAQSDFQRRARFNVGKRSALHSVDHASDAYAEGNFVVEVKSVVDVGCNLVRRDVGAVVVQTVSMPSVRKLFTSPSGR